MGDQPAMPRQQGIRSDDVDQAQQMFATHRLAFASQRAALVIIQARVFPQLLLEHTDFLLEIFRDGLFMKLHPSDAAGQQGG